jgi:excisionase family DNA binding protein
MIAHQDMIQEHLVKADTLAPLLGVSVRTVRKLQAEGVIPFVKLGKCVRFSPSRVTEAIAAIEQKPTEKTPAKIGPAPARN